MRAVSPLFYLATKTFRLKFFTAFLSLFARSLFFCSGSAKCDTWKDKRWLSFELCMQIMCDRHAVSSAITLHNCCCFISMVVIVAKNTKSHLKQSKMRRFGCFFVLRMKCMVNVMTFFFVWPKRIKHSSFRPFKIHFGISFEMIFSFILRSNSCHKQHNVVHWISFRYNELLFEFRCVFRLNDRLMCSTFFWPL